MRILPRRVVFSSFQPAFSWFAAIIALLALATASSTSQTNKVGSVDLILVLDTSASMRGAGGARDIFSTVKNSVGEFIRQAREGDSVTLFTYDSDTRKHPTVRILDQTDKRDLLRELDEVKAQGDRTHTGKALRDALERAAELGSRSDAATRTVSIVLFTDGIEDVRGVSNPVGIPSNIEMLPEKRPFIFFVSLGETEHEQQLDEFVKNPALQGRGEVVRDPGAQLLAELDDRIRTRIASPVELEISVEPASLDFGTLEPGETTAQHSLNVRSNLAARGHLSITDPVAGDLTLIEPKEPIDLQPGETTVPVQVSIAAGAPDGMRSFRITLTAQAPVAEATPRSVTVAGRVAVEHVPFWQRALKWLAILLILLLLVIIAFSLLKGELPWTILKNWRERDHLEGEIEIIKPVQAQPEAAFIGLLPLKRNKTSLDELVPGGVGGEANAQLSTRFKNGRKLINLTRTAGIVRVNQAETVTTDLFDGDLIEIGDARLRFNWMGHPRPTDPEDNY